MYKKSNKDIFKHFVEGNNVFPDEYPKDYFIDLYKTGKYTQAEIVLGIIGLQQLVCRVDLWYIHLRNSKIFKCKGSFDSAHDLLNEHSNHFLRNSIEKIGTNEKGKYVFQITETGMNNVKMIFPDIYDFHRIKVLQIALKRRTQFSIIKILL